MIDVIANEIKKIMLECCDREAKKRNLKLDEIQLTLKLNVIETDEGIGIDAENPNKYIICEKFTQKDELTIWQVLNLKYPKLDFKNYAGLSVPFIFKSLARFSENYQIEPTKVAILCVPEFEDNKKDMNLALYNGSEFLKEIKFFIKENDAEDSEYLFNAEDFEMTAN